MIPAYCKLALCPHCGAKKEIIQLMSGNTFDTVLWSDTKQIAPMLPKASPIQKCPSCKHYYLLNEVNFEEGKKYSFDEGWLTFEDSVAAFYELNNDETNKLEFLTIIVTWAFNDIIRNNGTPTDEQFRLFKKIISQNLSHPIFQDNYLFRGELYREISEYDKCLCTLSEYNPDNVFLANIQNEIIKNAKNRINKVFVIK